MACPEYEDPANEISPACRSISRMLHRRKRVAARKFFGFPPRCLHNWPQIDLFSGVSAIDELTRLANEAATISSAASVLGWDQETYLPPAATALRAQQIAWLSGRAHELASSVEWKDALDAAVAEAQAAGGDSRRLGNLAEMARRFERDSRLPASLVERESETSSLAKHAWADARKHSDFRIFAPHLEKLLELAREKAELWGYPDEPYDALLETYERGASTASLSAVLDPLAPRLAEIAAAAVERSRSVTATMPPGPYPVAEQMAFNEKVARSLGFDFERGRIDTTSHPFCTTLGPHDIRLTTRYDEDDFSSSLFGVMHETGHGLYEQGLCPDDFGTPAGDSVSLGIHESQSRLWENHIGRSRAFWEKWLPIAAEHFPQLAAMSLDDFLAVIHRVEFSYVRVESDEATYDLHILLRFDLERRLLRGELQVADLPAVWNESFQKNFGMTPPNDTLGCLQDIHWAMGGLGYFPTYTLGNLNAAQLFAAAMEQPEISSTVAGANYGPLLGWLREKVHHPGATVSPAEIITEATGYAPSPEAHLRHLKRRYQA